MPSNEAVTSRLSRSLSANFRVIVGIVGTTQRIADAETGYHGQDTENS